MKANGCNLTQLGLNDTQLTVGGSVDIDGNLACVENSYGTHLYHRNDGSKWIQFDTIEDGDECSISGRTIAVYRGSIQLYKYNQDLNEVVPIQGGQISEGYFESIDLNKDYLVSLWEQDVFVHHSNEINRTVSFHQKLNIGPFSYDENQLALGDDILVVGSDNHTYIYSLQDGDWMESITLDESFDNIKISGRTLLVTKDNNTSLASEVYSFNIQDCTQDMPTQLPSLSPSSRPSVSSLPTTAFRFTCFEPDDGGYDGILYNAVRSYVSQDCANNEECEIGQVYDWPMNSWCVGNVKSMSSLFQSMDTFNEDINGWNTSSVTTMYSMFEGASSFNRNLSNFDTSSVNNMVSMFYRASSFSGQGVSNFDTSSVTKMNYMFLKASSFDSDVSSFDTSSVTDMTSMFAYARAFNQDLSNFDTSSVTTMIGMFNQAKAFNGDVSSFDTSRVTDMGGMFSGATSFNGDVSNFNTSSAIDMGSMFEEATSFNGDVSNFDTSSVTDMRFMFSKASSFNKDLSNFNTSSVAGMSWMFWGATSFDGDVSNFDVSSVTDMTEMFDSATSFSQDLCSWQDNFPYTKADDIFEDSGCTYQDTPQEVQQGPFCASDCGGAPSVSPTSSTAPTKSVQPTQSPTVSSSPTDTCYWVDIVVVFDDYPEETSWDIQTINEPGDNVVLKTFNGTSEANKLQSESMCLKVGEYQFTIYDEYGDGIEAPGHYNVTSEGNLIVKGGQFGHSESTIFSIPYEPPVVLTVLDIVQPLGTGEDHTLTLSPSGK